MLWRHLEYYLLYCVPGENGISLYQLNMRRQTPRRLQGMRFIGRKQVL